MSKRKNRLKLSHSVAKDQLVKQVAKEVISAVMPQNIEKGDMPQVFAVPMGFNSSMGTSNKRMTSSQVEPFILRQLSIQHETARAAINTRKRQITQLDFEVADAQNDGTSATSASKQEEARQKLMGIGGAGVRFRELLDKMIEDLLVLDGVALYKQKTRGGQLLRLVPVDSATIKLRVDQAGMTPMAPEIAYEQWVNGKKVADLTTDEMIYEKMNARTDSPYGLSPIESMVISLDTSMRAMLYNLNYLSDNNLPMGFLQMPEGWTVGQLKEYKEWFDAMVSGSKQTSKLYPIPSSTTYQAVSKPTDFAFADFFDYLDRRICMLFDIQPQELGLALKQYKENAEGQEKIQLRKGIRPLANFLEEIFTDILKNELGYAGFEFKFVGLDGRYTLDQMKTLVPLGIMGMDEARNDMGLAKIGVGNVIITGNTITPIGSEGTTISGTPQETPNEGKDSTKMEKSLQKLARNLGFEAVEKKKTFQDFKKRIKMALRRQLKPFTQEEAIAQVTESKKADFAGIVEDNIDTATPSLQVYFDNGAIDDFLKWAAEQGGDNAYSSLGISQSFDLTSKDFKRLLGDRTKYLIDSVDSTTKDWIIDQILDGKDLSLTNYEIAQKIADGIEEISQFRAEMIVNTEVANAMQLAELDVYTRQGIEKKMWVTSEDGNVDPICSEMDNEIVDVDHSFSSGDDAPPAHPNCRCYIQAVLN